MKIKKLNHNLYSQTKPVEQGSNVKIGRWSLGMAILILCVVGLRVLVSARIATLGDRLEELESSRLELTRSVQILETNSQRLASLTRIESEALNKLQMTKPASGQGIFIDANHTKSLAKL